MTTEAEIRVIPLQDMEGQGVGLTPTSVKKQGRSLPRAFRESTGPADLHVSLLASRTVRELNKATKFVILCVAAAGN